MWSIDVRWRREPDTGRCHATAEVSRGKCQSGVGVRRGLKDWRVRGQTGMVVRHGWRSSKLRLGRGSVVGSRTLSRTICQRHCCSEGLLYAEGVRTAQNRVEDQVVHDVSAGVVNEVICGADPRLKVSWPGAPAGPRGIRMTAVSHTCSDISPTPDFAAPVSAKLKCPVLAILKCPLFRGSGAACRIQCYDVPGQAHRLHAAGGHSSGERAEVPGGAGYALRGRGLLLNACLSCRTLAGSAAASLKAATAERNTGVPPSSAPRGFPWA